MEDVYKRQRLYRAGKHFHHFGGDGLEFDQLICAERASAEAADRQRRAVESEWRNDGVYTGAVGQAGVDHRRRLVDAPPDTGNDAVDDLQQVTIVAE